MLFLGILLSLQYLTCFSVSDSRDKGMQIAAVLKENQMLPVYQVYTPPKIPSPKISKHPYFHAIKQCQFPREAQYMKINSDINILGGLSDWNLVSVFLDDGNRALREEGGIHSFTAIKTDKSVSRFRKAITATLLHFRQEATRALVTAPLAANGITRESLLLLFWNASHNNDLLHYLNERVFFPAFYGGRVTIRKEEVEACINDLKASEESLKRWTAETINTTASKYLTLLKKFGLMEGAAEKKIVHPHLSDEQFILFVYWLAAVSGSSNLLKSNWLQYGFTELQHFLDRLLQKKYAKYFNVVYTGDRLMVEPLIPYEAVYDNLRKP
jgi:hypothetical protein